MFPKVCARRLSERTFEVFLVLRFATGPGDVKERMQCFAIVAQTYFNVTQRTKKRVLEIYFHWITWGSILTDGPNERFI